MGIKIQTRDIQQPRTQGWGVVHLKAGETIPARDDHSHPYDEYVVMLQGCCLLRNAGELIEYRAGDVGFFPRHQVHNAVEAIEDTVYVWMRGDKPPESAHEPDRRPAL